MAVQATKLMTADELLALPDDNMRHELVRGMLTTEMPPGKRHGKLSGEIIFLLRLHLRDNPVGEVLGEVGFILERDPDTVRAPDVAFIAADRAAAIGDTEKYWPEAPALAVEVVSPNDSFGEVDEKARTWLAAGTKLVLVVDPEHRTANVYAPGSRVTTYDAGATIDLSAAVPGWQLHLSELFS